MLNRFFPSSSISAPEFSILQTYFANPHQFSDIAASPYFDLDFLFGLRITAPIDNIRYFILPCDEDDEDEDLYSFPINKPLVLDNFQHEAIFLDDKTYVFLPAEDAQEKLKLAVNQDNHFYVIKACEKDLDFETINPDLYPFPAIQYAEYFFQIMNYAGMDLALFLAQHPNLNTIQKDIIAQGLIAEVQKLHSKHFIHTDIKASNFCIRQSDLSVCLVDYDEIINADEIKYNESSMGTFTFLGPEFFQNHVVQFAKSAKSLRQFEICIYQALTQIHEIFYPYFFQKRTKSYPFKSHSFFGNEHHYPLFSSLSHIETKPSSRFTRFDLEKNLLKDDWKKLFSKESDLYALACLLKFELKIQEDSRVYLIMQQMLNREPTQRRIAAHR